MALQGVVDTNPWYSSGGYTLSVGVEWTATQNIANNSTSIKWKLVCHGSYMGTVTVSELRVKFDGEQIYYRGYDKHTDCTSGTVLASGTKTVAHNGDGTKAITISVEAGIYNWAINKSGSKTFTLDTIARSSTITSAKDTTLGENCEITWTPASKNFRYFLEFQLGGWQHQSGWIYPNTLSAYTYSEYIVPLDVAKRISNANSGSMTVYLHTYNGDTKVGSTSNKIFTVRVPESLIPSISKSDVVATIISDSAEIERWGVGVAGYSKVKLDAIAHGSYGSSIKSFRISGIYNVTIPSSPQSQTGNLSYTGDIVSSSSHNTLTIEAIDSRGRVSSPVQVDNLSFYSYAAPFVESFIAERDSVNTRRIRVLAQWVISSIGGNNKSTGTLYYKASSSNAWQQAGTVENGVAFYPSVIFDEGKSYNLKLVITDSLNNKGQEEFFITTIYVLLDFKSGGKGLGIGKVAESDAMEVALPSIFMNDIFIQVSPGDTVKLDEYIRRIVGAN